MAIVIPPKVLSEAGVSEGDILKLSIPVSAARRKRIWAKVAGIDCGRSGFSREKHDRINDW